MNGDAESASVDPADIRRIFAALAEGDWDVAVGLVELHWGSLVKTAPHAIHAVVFALPEDERKDSQRWQQLARTRKLMLRTGPATAPPQGNAGELLLHLATLTEQAADALERGDVAPARSAARRAVAFYRAMTEQQRRAAGLTLPRHLLSWARVIRAVDDDQDGRNLLEEAYAWSVSSGQLGPAIESASELAADDALLGRSQAAQQWVQRAAILYRANANATGPPPAAQFALAIMSADRLAFKQALAHLAQSASRALLRPAPGPRIVPRPWRSFLPAPNRAELTADLDSACDTPSRTRLGEIVELSARVRVDLLEGHRHRAVTRLAAVDGERFGAWIAAGRAALHLRLGDVRAAELDASFALERVADSPRSDVELQSIQAALQLRKSQFALARSTFRDAVTMADLHRLPAALLVIPLADLRALSEVSYHEDQPALLVRLLATVPDAEPARPVVAKLSARELLVLRALESGSDATIAEIAEHLQVSRNTLKSQLRSIYRKVGASDRNNSPRDHARGRCPRPTPRRSSRTIRTSPGESRGDLAGPPLPPLHKLEGERVTSERWGNDPGTPRHTVASRGAGLPRGRERERWGTIAMGMQLCVVLREGAPAGRRLRAFRHATAEPGGPRHDDGSTSRGPRARASSRIRRRVLASPSACWSLTSATTTRPQRSWTSLPSSCEPASPASSG